MTSHILSINPNGQRGNITHIDLRQVAAINSYTNDRGPRSVTFVLRSGHEISWQSFNEAEFIDIISRWDTSQDDGPVRLRRH